LTQTPSPPDIGEITPDGTVYVGNSPTTGDAMYTTPEDVGVVDVLHAERLIKKLNATNAFGHDDWRLPDAAEKATLLSTRDRGSLSNTFNNRELLGGHRTLCNLYLSSNYLADDPHHAGHMRIEDDDGYQMLINRKSGIRFAIRPVRLVR
jgi:hypothetical protein